VWLRIHQFIHPSNGIHPSTHPMGLCFCFHPTALSVFTFFPRISTFFDLSITEETWVVEMHIWCIKIVYVIVLHSSIRPSNGIHPSHGINPSAHPMALIHPMPFIRPTIQWHPSIDRSINKRVRKQKPSIHSSVKGLEKTDLYNTAYLILIL
jgi:hypothetical protein